MFLTKDEKILYETQPNILPFVLGPILGFVIFLIIALVYIVYMWSVWGGLTSYFWEVCMIPLVIFIIILIVSILFSYLRWKNTHYAMTNKRAMTTAGIFGKAVVDCRYDKIQNITMVQGFFERLLGYGTVVFATAGLGGGGWAGTAWRGGTGWGYPGAAMGMGNVMFIAVNEPIAMRKFAQETMDDIMKQKKKQEYKEMAAAFGEAGTPAPKPGAPVAKGRKFCEKCGSPISPGAAFCASCGAKL
jgi:membrane protein YdbS with pleckstrin-like domain